MGGVLAGGALCWLVIQYAFHLKLLNVQTGSMYSAFRPGDALVLQRERASELRPGMVVAYRSIRNPSEMITHRLIRITPGTFQTKGDALAVPDPQAQTSLLVGRVTAVLPGTGRVLGWLATWPGLVACMYIPAAFIVRAELVRLEWSYRKVQRYQLYKAQMV